MNNLLKTYKVNNFTVSKYRSLDSTMNLARTAKSDTVIFTEKQTAGRGKGDRKWECKEGNLFFSIKLQPKKPLQEVFQLSFLSALALINTINSLDKNKNLEVSCKWPNDVLINGNKVSGILIESDTASYKKNNIEYDEVVLGIGVNIIYSPEVVMYKATNLLDSGIDTNAEKFLNAFLLKFEEYYKNWHEFGFNNLRNEWIQKSYNLGKEVRFKINDSDDMTIGIFKEFTENGEMVAELPDGTTQTISSGDIFK